MVAPVQSAYNAISLGGEGGGRAAHLLDFLQGGGFGEGGRHLYSRVHSELYSRVHSELPVSRHIQCPFSVGPSG